MLEFASTSAGKTYLSNISRIADALEKIAEGLENMAEARKNDPRWDIAMEDWCPDPLCPVTARTGRVSHPAFVPGTPGESKTDALVETAEKAGVPIEIIDLSEET